MSKPEKPEAAAVWVDIDKLTPWDKNPRKNDDAAKEIAKSIKRFGFGSPIIARKADGEVIAGHTRLKAAQILGLKSVPVRYLDLDPAEAHLLALADNRLGEKAEWDDALLAEVMSGFSFDDVEFAGWTQDDLEKMGSDALGGGPSGDDAHEDELPDVPKNPITKTGDIWALGSHRLACGDSTDRRLVAALLNSKVEAVFTDPPYGVDYVGKTKDALPVHNDGAGTLAELLNGSLTIALEHCSAGAPWFVCSPAGPNHLEFGNWLRDKEILRQTLVWVKDSMVLGHSDYHYKHEFIFYGWVPGAAHVAPPDRKQVSVWEFDRPKSSPDHPTPKPVKLVAYAIEMSTKPGAVVYDPFLGSGTTIIACEQMERIGCGLEFSPAYCDVIVDRWQTLTGGKAKLLKNAS